MTLLEMPDAAPNGDGTNRRAGSLHVGQWRLAHVEVLNWGTFDGLYEVEIARKGHLFTGASGSGKSSLLDAIATVLTPDRWLRFNAAAQETQTRNDDRSLVSYVRGAWSKEADEHLDRAVSTHLRKGATWSGILLRYDNELDAPITVVRLFHLRGSSIDKSNLKDACFIDRGEVKLLDFEELVLSGIEARRIKSTWPDAVVTTNWSHGPFYAKLQRLLDIRSHNALHLLHKTQSAKNLGTLDQLFRSFMLNEPTTFARATNAVTQFGELRDAHHHVVQLRRQSEHLRELDASIVQYEQASAEAAEAERLSALIDPFQDQLILRLAGEERGMLRTERAESADSARRANAARDDAAERLRTAEQRASRLGGSDVSQLQARLADAKTAAATTGSRWERFGEEVGSVGITAPPTTGAEFGELQESSRRELETPAPELAHDTDDNQQYFSARDELKKIDRELEELRSRKSNLPAPLLVARKQLADELGIGEAALPFAGELIEVLPEHAEWTGAIERVLYPLASALLVRDEHLAEVRRKVEQRTLGARLVFEAVPAIVGPTKAAKADRSLLHRIRVTSGGFGSWLQTRVASEFDYACVENPDQLDAVERGVTIGGQVKKSARRYEKNDRYAVTDRRQWILGADNQSKIELLYDRRQEVSQQQDESRSRLERASTKRDATVKRRTVLESIVRHNWAELDRTAANKLVQARRRQLDELTTGNSELHDAIAAEGKARERLRSAETTALDATLQLGRVEDRLIEVDTLITTISDRMVDDAIADVDAIALENRYRSVQRKIDRQSVEGVGRKVAETLHGVSTSAQATLRSAESTFAKGAIGFSALWPAAAADLTESIRDCEGYRALLADIQARGLPEHEGNFLRLLREKSRDLIGHLLSDIRDAPKQVVDRIDPVNASLGRSRFDDERYLRIEVKTRRAPEVTEFMGDLKSVVDGAWNDENLAAAESRFAVLNRVMTRLGSSDNADLAWKRRCLDTREHVTFMAYEVDLAGRVVNVHDSSAGLSGGQRQKLVIFCLAAALRYQLAADEDEVPSYATIILDEAFDKADSRYTRMAMEVFVEFGFHMILATPEKLLQTIEPYVGAVSSITNPTRRQSSIASLMFQPQESAAGA